MTTCPKCGARKIVGPKYERAGVWGQTERLRYRCLSCGYSMTTPTLDQQDRERRGMDALLQRRGSDPK